jgi:hypothetical protein
MDIVATKDDMIKVLVNALRGIQTSHERLFRENHWMEDGPLYVARLTLAHYDLQKDKLL